MCSMWSKIKIWMFPIENLAIENLAAIFPSPQAEFGAENPAIQDNQTQVSGQMKHPVSIVASIFLEYHSIICHVSTKRTLKLTQMP